MSTEEQSQDRPSPSDWDGPELDSNWQELIESVASANDVPLKRVQLQASRLAVFKSAQEGWTSMDGAERRKAWNKVVAALATSVRDPIRQCVRCGECCRCGSPTLHLQTQRTSAPPFDAMGPTT